MKKPRKPLPRSKTPIKRSPLKRGLGRRGKLKAAQMKALHEKYGEMCCQWVVDKKERSPFLMLGFRCPFLGTDFHHKKLRSQGGKDTAENLVALCRQHHTEAHNDFSKLERIRQSGANLLNGETIQ